jgi:hypothetical protein
MAPMNILLADWKFLNAPNMTAGADIFISERSLVWDYASSNTHDFMGWISQPRMLL